MIADGLLIKEFLKFLEAVGVVGRQIGRLAEILRDVIELPAVRREGW